MTNEQEEMLKEFFDTYIETFLLRRLREVGEHSKRIIIALAETAIETSKEEFTAFLEEFYPNDKNNLKTYSLHHNWLTIYNIFHNQWKQTPAEKLSNYLNDQRVFGNTTIDNEEITNFLKNYARSWLIFYKEENNLNYISSLPSVFYSAAANGDYAELKKLDLNEYNLDTLDTLCGYSMLHLALTAVGVKAATSSFDDALEAVKCVLYLLENKASPNILNLEKQTPVDLFLQLLPDYRQETANPFNLRCMVTALTYYKKAQGILPSDLDEILKTKGYNPIIEEVTQLMSTKNLEPLEQVGAVKESNVFPQKCLQLQ